MEGNRCSWLLELLHRAVNAEEAEKELLHYTLYSIYSVIPMDVNIRNVRVQTFTFYHEQRFLRAFPLPYHLHYSP